MENASIVFIGMDTRLLRSLKQTCYIVASSLIPKKPDDHVKTDRKDSMMLAQF